MRGINDQSEEIFFSQMNIKLSVMCNCATGA